MDIKRNGSRPFGKGPSEWFTGTVRIDPLFEAPGQRPWNSAALSERGGSRPSWGHFLGFAKLGRSMFLELSANLSCRPSFALKDESPKANSN